MVDGQPPLDGRDDADHLLLVQLHRAAEGASAILLEGDESLVGGRVHEVLLAAQEAGGLGGAHVLCAEAGYVGGLGVAPEVVQGVDLRGRVGYDGHAGVVGYLDGLLQRQHRLGVARTHQVGDGGGIVTDGRLELLPRAPVLVADLDQRRAGDGEAAVVAVALRLLDDDLALHSGRVGYTAYLVEVAPGHAGRGAERQGRGAAGRDVSRLDAQQVGDVLAGPRQQLGHLDVGVVDGGHRLGDLGYGGRAAEHGPVALGIYHSPRADLCVYVCPCCCHVVSSILPLEWRGRLAESPLPDVGRSSPTRVAPTWLRLRAPLSACPRLSALLPRT